MALRGLEPGSGDPLALVLVRQIEARLVDQLFWGREVLRFDAFAEEADLLFRAVGQHEGAARWDLEGLHRVTETIGGSDDVEYDLRTRADERELRVGPRSLSLPGGP